MVESYRCVMEVLKFFEPKTVLKNAAGVSVQWKRVVDSDELWALFIQAEGLEELVDEDLPTMKAKFRDVIENSHIDRFVILSKEKKVKVFQYTTETFLNEFIPPPDVLTRYNAIAILSNAKLFVCGRNWNAFIVSMRNGAVTPLPSMLESRAHHSVLYSNRKVYVFGGREGLKFVKTAECFGLKERMWERLPDMMNPRGAFNACYRDKKIYLCGGQTTACEVFDIDSLQYTSLAFPLPEANWTVSVFYHNKLTAIIRQTAYILEGTGWRKVNIEMLYVPLGFSSAGVHGLFVYIPMSYCSRVMKINLNTHKSTTFSEDGTEA